MAKTHAVHTDVTGTHSWTEHGHHCGCGHHVHHDDPASDCPQGIPIVVVRCRCKDPESHAQDGKHCPEGEIDVQASLAASTGMNIA